MILPKQRRPPLQVDPKRLLLFGQPKSGKTSILASLDDCLIIDMEQGSGFLSAMSVEVNNLADYKALRASLDAEMEANGGKKPYKRIAIDTLTALEELSLPYATKLYNQTPMGAGFKGDVRTLPNGAGYLYTRNAFFKMLKPLENYCDTLIMIGHMKEKDITKSGESLTEKSINLTGQTKNILCAWADTIGLVYREENKTIIDFAPSDELIVGSRQEHLIGQKVCIAESDANHKLNIDWGAVFKEL
jgi:hypothetical protein